MAPALVPREAEDEVDAAPTEAIALRRPAGIDMALLVVARYFGEPVGRATARHLEYPFPDDNRRRV